MQHHKLPISINPTRLAEKEATLAGVLSLANMPRLKDLLADTTGEAAVTMHFGYDESHTAYIHLTVNVSLLLICQRCMENFSYPMTIDVLLNPIIESEKTPNTQEHPKRAAKLPRQSQNQAYEPLMMESETVILQDIVEDEILLNLPLIPKHTQDVCPVVLSASKESETENPFKVYFSKTHFRDKI